KEPMTSFKLAKDFLERRLGKDLVDSKSTEHLKVFLLSKPEEPIFDSALEKFSASGKFDKAAYQALSETLQSSEIKCSTLHLGPLQAVKKAQAIFDDPSNQQKDRFFYFISDFREKDWGEEAPRELQEAFKKLAKDSNAKVNLVDVAHPDRLEAPQSP